MMIILEVIGNHDIVIRHLKGAHATLEPTAFVLDRR